MIDATLPTIDRRRRTSDGTAECCICKENIPEGVAYQENQCSSQGVLVERNYCLKCLSAKDVSDKASWVAVIVISILAWAAFAAMVSG